MPSVGGGKHGAIPPRSLLSSALATYATNLLVAALSLGNVLVVARALGPEGRGAVAFLTTVAVLTSSLATLGVEHAHANLAGRSPGSRPALATNSVLLALAFGALAAGGVAGLAALFPAVGGGADPQLRTLVLAALPLLVLKVYLDYLVRADYGHGWANAAWALEAVVNLGANAVLALAGSLTVGLAVGVWLAGQTLAAAVLVGFVLRRGAGFGRPRAALAASAVGFGAKAHAGRVLTLGNYRLDQWLVGSIAGARELGLYSVAVAWAEALFFLPTALVLAQRPDLVRADRGEAARQAALAARLTLALTLPASVAFVLAAPFLCTVVFGSAFAGSVDDLRVLAWGALGMVLLKVLGSALTAQGRPLRSTAGVAVAFVATVVLNLLLVPDLGGLGAAIASTAAYSAGGLAIAVLFTRAFAVSPRALLPQRGDLAYLREAARRLADARRAPRAA